MSNESNYSIYESALSRRYSSSEMLHLFSDEYKIKVWRGLWIALAKCEQKLGIPISDNQIAELEREKSNIDFEAIKRYEKDLRHDVMANIHALGELCPEARKIIHLGATSAFVVDNGDLIIMKEGLKLVKKKLVNVIKRLANFASEYKSLPANGYTHFQTAQLTTVGKRACLWLNELVFDYREIKRLIAEIPFRGVKGTTGTQASFMKLFDNDENKVKQLDKMVSEETGFPKSLTIASQTYTRKIDHFVMSALCGIGQTCAKFSNDIRLLQNLKEIEEPFGKKQIGSSAMPYKRNPMRSERIMALARYLITLEQNTAFNSASQWLERTLDDSANKRMTIPEAFLTADALLIIMQNVCEGLVVNEKVIDKHVMNELPFIASENILMEAVKNGADRQDIHEKIRKYSMEVYNEMNEKGIENRLMEKFKNDPAFMLTDEIISKIMDKNKYIGRCISQVDEFIYDEVNPILEDEKGLIEDKNVQLNV